MKYAIVLLFILTVFDLSAQEKPDLNIVPEQDGIVRYSGVVQLDSSIKADDIFNRAKIWFVDNYKSANDVLQMEDKASGILPGKELLIIHIQLEH